MKRTRSNHGAIPVWALCIVSVLVILGFLWFSAPGDDALNGRAQSVPAAEQAVEAKPRSAAKWAAAGGDGIAAVRDTFISEHPNLRGPNRTHGTAPSMAHTELYVIGSRRFRASALVAWDVSGFAGRTVIGTPVVGLYLRRIHQGGGFVSNTIEMRRVLAPAWKEASATFANTYEVVDANSTLESTRTVWKADGSGYYLSWTLSAQAVQSWIDDPGSNHGLFFKSVIERHRQDVVFDSRERGANGPRLAFELGPWPGE